MLRQTSKQRTAAINTEKAARVKAFFVSVSLYDSLAEKMLDTHQKIGYC